MTGIIFAVTYAAGLVFWDWYLDRREEEKERKWQKWCKEKNKRIDEKYGVDWKKAFSGIYHGVGACTREEYEVKVREGRL